MYIFLGFIEHLCGRNEKTQKNQKLIFLATLDPELASPPLKTPSDESKRPSIEDTEQACSSAH